MVRGEGSAGGTRVFLVVSWCLVLQIEPIKRKEEARMEPGSTGGVVLGQRRVPFKELRMGTLLGAGGCGPHAACLERIQCSCSV